MLAKNLVNHSKVDEILIHGKFNSSANFGALLP